MHDGISNITSELCFLLKVDAKCNLISNQSAQPATIEKDHRWVVFDTILVIYVCRITYSFG